MKPVIMPFKGILPKIHETAYIAPGATVIGNVEIGAESSIWPGVVIRGDVNYIRIGRRTNIQDNTVIHVSRPSIAGEAGQTIIGDNVTIGHGAILHACILEDECFVGMGASVLDGAVVKNGGMVAAGALVTYGKIVPKGEIWAGNPAKLFRAMKQPEIDFILKSAENYVQDSREYLNEMKG